MIVPASAGGGAEQAQHGLAGFGVEGGRRLVGQHQRGAIDQGAGDRHPLSLTAGKLGREMLESLAQSELLGYTNCRLVTCDFIVLHFSGGRSNGYVANGTEVLLRNELRVLEQKVNSQANLSAEDKATMQGYITRCYGSLTTFNILFHDERDKFVGQKGKD